MSMHRVYAAALELQVVLKGLGYPYCFIGGLVLQRWGEPRMTQDADASVLTSFEHDDEVIERLLARFKSRREGGPEFARRNRVLLLEAQDGTALDVALGALPFEARAMDRSSDWKVTKTDSLRTCSADDLVVYKAFASRDRDWIDLDGILVRQGKKLNVAQIFEELAPLVALKEDDSIVLRLQEAMRRRGIKSQQ